MLGFESAKLDEFTLFANKTFNFLLKEESQTLNEVVVGGEHFAMADQDGVRGGTGVVALRGSAAGDIPLEPAAGADAEKGAGGPPPHSRQSSWARNLP